MQDVLGDRMKAYEGNPKYNSIIATGDIMCVRIDGRSFSNFTKGFLRPFDDKFLKWMQQTCKELVAEFDAEIGFVQSDEISLIITSKQHNNKHIFSGRTQKLVSAFAASATSTFAEQLRADGFEGKYPTFDARVWVVPSKTEAANSILWRSQDARRNGISSAYRWTQGKNMYMKSQDVLLEEMLENGVDYENSFCDAAKTGTYFQHKVFQERLSESIMLKIPPHLRGTGEYVRRRVVEVPIKYFGDVENRVGVIFDGEAPTFKS